MLIEHRHEVMLSGKTLTFVELQFPTQISRFAVRMFC